MVLTRDQKFRKKNLNNKERKLYQLAFKKYPKLLAKLTTMPERYNKLREEIEKLFKDQKIYVIRPQKEVTVSRLEKDKEKLKALYEDGYQQALDQMSEIKQYIEGEKE